MIFVKYFAEFCLLSLMVIETMGATCKLLGILESDLDQLNIILDNTPSICQSFNNENISQKTCCSLEREKKIIRAWDSIRGRTMDRTNLISQIIANISIAQNMNSLNDYIFINTTNSNVTARLLEENFENSKAEYKEYLESNSRLL